MPLRLGLVGAGFIAGVYAHAARRVPAVEITAVASPRSARAFADRWGIPAAFDDWRQLIGEAPVDAVVIAAPNDLHLPVALAAAAAGKHVLCEKPLAPGLPAAAEMVEACDRAGVLLLCAENLLFAPMYERVRALVRRGEIGQPYLLRQQQGHAGPYADWFWDISRAGGGALIDIGCHGIALACRQLDAWPEAVAAVLGRFRHAARTPADDHAIVHLRFPGGALATVEASWALPGGADLLEIVGARGGLAANLERAPAIDLYRDPESAEAGQLPGWQHVMYEEAWQFGFPQELEHFAEAAAGRVEPRFPGRDAVRVLEIICAAYESARRGGGWVSLPFPSTAPRAIDHWLAAEPPAAP
ncbi:Gfo/Idh/MocA family oxidoreductase [Tepidiforma sp.]|jgi:myo-inositol 2-dehydrogenase/D-chiro-inositol 1-dehydrogenase|uniref:Gfo/Idh/MocA family protein n=1 Tax=Tepidiforma sp. TaxID=2682230 RepID=UPI0026252DF0|nr:Gfo/Idh/MocA family oxidoreductase [Tepidiforma sp.]MCX7617773.1 Gfo/Idh/MocA family oxidoreductase [Tepidiforma sp.]